MPVAGQGRDPLSGGRLQRPVADPDYSPLAGAGAASPPARDDDPQTLPEAAPCCRAGRAEDGAGTEGGDGCPGGGFAKQIASVEKGITLSAFAQDGGPWPQYPVHPAGGTQDLDELPRERWNLPMQESMWTAGCSRPGRARLTATASGASASPPDHRQGPTVAGGATDP